MASTNIATLLEGKAAFVRAQLQAGQRPTPAQISTFLRALVQEASPERLAPLVPMLEARLGWSVARNAPVFLSALGVWRVAQRSVHSFAGWSLKKVKELLPLGVGKQ